MTPTDTMLSTPEVCRVTGLSYRQIDSWTRLGVFRPVVSARGSGTQRRYTVDQAIAVRACFILSHLHAGTDVMRGLSSAMAARPELVGQRVIVPDHVDALDLWLTRYGIEALDLAEEAGVEPSGLTEGLLLIAKVRADLAVIEHFGVIAWVRACP